MVMCDAVHTVVVSGDRFLHTQADIKTLVGGGGGGGGGDFNLHLNWMRLLI